MNYFAKQNPEEILQTEILAEKAASLGRIARRLESLIHTLKEMQNTVENAQLYEKVRREAHEYFWYLTVQREALGIRDHRLLSSVYRIPEPTLEK